MDGKGEPLIIFSLKDFGELSNMNGPLLRYIYINPSNGGHELYFGIEEYMRFYNYERPHDSIEKETPARKFGQIKTNIISTKYSTTLV